MHISNAVRRWIRRRKRQVLTFASKCGYDIEKQATGLPPYRFLKRLPLGDDPLADVRKIHGGEIRCVFDVGAHVGQSAALFSDTFLGARIHSFEPDPVSFGELRRLADSYPRIIAVNAAAGDRPGEQTFFVNKFSMTNSLLRPAEGADRFLVVQDGLNLRTETKTRVITLDCYCSENNVDQIDFLKLDTQGYEIRVLEGARRLLERQAVPLIYLEVSFVPLYEDQPLFPQVYQYLYDRHYRMVWLYERSFHTHLFSVGANALFVHEKAGGRISRAPGVGAGSGERLRTSLRNG
jgi:FkbM family methyltransferase